MLRPLLGRAVLLVAVLAGCAAPGTPAVTPARATGAAPPYEVPVTGGARDEGGAELARTEGEGEGGPIPVTAADPVRGSRTAPVTIVEFADFQCPFCQRAAATMAELMRQYGPGQLRIVWKHYPLPFHADARPAAEAGAALFERGGSPWFWRYHDALFGTTRALTRELVDAAAETAGAAPGDVQRALQRGTAASKVASDVALASRLGVSAAPAFYINGVLVSGAQPIDAFRAVIDAQLQRARAALAAGTPATRLYAQLATQGYAAPKREAPSREPEDDRKVYRVPVDASPVQGKPTAQVTIVEFADFQCPYCLQAEETLRLVRAKYGDKVRVVWKNEPLPFHKWAEPAAELALEARAQKGDAGFWAVHDLLLAQRSSFQDGDLEDIAKVAGLDVVAAMRSVQKHKHQQAIDEDVDLADDLDATGTPTFFVNGRKLVGAQPLETFVSVIDDQLAAAQAQLAHGVPPAKLYETLQKSAVGGVPEKVNVPPPSPTAPSRGPQDAKVVVQIWSDFQCPFCKRVEPTLAELDAAFPGKLRFVWHNHPLPFHPLAEPAAEAAMEAHAQKGDAGFWRMHDLLLQNPGGGGLDRPALEQYASSLGLDLGRFRTALDGSLHHAAIEADTRAAEAAGLTGTPGFAINGYKVSGAQPLVKFRRVVQRALTETK